MNKKFVKIVSLLFCSLILLPFTNVTAQLDYLMSIKKIDIHTHISSDAPFLRKFLDEYNMKLNTLCTGGLDTAHMRFQIDQAKKFSKEHPRYYSWVTTFDLTKRDDPDWTENVIKKLKDDFDHGAIGVKIWKEIGMEIKDKDGNYIMVDDPMFDPIYDFIAKEGKTLIAHIGEPIQAWMPDHPESSGVPLGYWGRHPKFSFWDKPDRPSYNEIMAARDHVISKHPNLRFVGAHLASLEFDVDEIEKRLEAYPNFAVEIGGRMRYFMWQARGKVRDFFLKFQDRIMYGTDLSAGEVVWDNKEKKEREATKDEMDEMLKRLKYRHNLFLRYLATDDEIPWGNHIIGDIPLPQSAYNVEGLALSKEVLEKVFYKNAVKWFPGVNKDY